jgi:hypothetical protein
MIAGSPKGLFSSTLMPLAKRRVALLWISTLAGVSPMWSQATGLHLIPMPVSVSNISSQPLAGGVQITCSAPCAAEDEFAIADLKTSLARRGVEVNETAAAHVLVTRFGSAIAKSIYRDSLPADSAERVGGGPIEMPDAMKAEGYVIIPDGKGLAITAASAEGVFYALQTVKQLVDAGPGRAAVLHTATIRDWPAMKYRGLDDDLSRGPVTTLEFQKKLIRTLAAYKVNLYSPYFEHTAGYVANPLWGPPGGTVTAADAAALVAYAKPYHVMIVPEQEAFGHLHHNLTWEQYQMLAETPHGAVLAPGQAGSLALTTQMLTELAGQYPGPFLHIGADETVDLGLGQTKADVDTRGLAPVYLDFMQRIATAVEPLHRRLLFWGDIAQDAPDLLKQLPDKFKQQTIAIAWVYSPEPKGYDRFLNPFKNAGFETWVAPSVNNYRKVYPNNNLALLNIQEFARDGQRLGSTGLLNTIWNDDGEGLFNQDWYGILFGAAAAWQKGESSIPQFQDSYAQVFHNDATGKLNQAQKELMAAHAVLKDQAKVGDASNSIFWLDPLSKDGLKIGAQVRPYTHELRLHAEAALTLIVEAKAAAGAKAVPEHPAPMTAVYEAEIYGAASSNLEEPDAVDAMELGARRMDLIGLNFQLADEIVEGYQRAYAAQGSTDKKVRAGVGRELSDINGVNGRIEDMRDRYSLLRDMFAAEWLRSNRPYALRPVLEHYDYTVGLLLARSDRFRSALRQWNDSHTLPAAADLGIPSALATAPVGTK